MGVTVDTTRLQQSLDALDPAGRALLELSLGRGLPDEELADLLGAEPGEVGRRRAEVVERIAEDLGVAGDHASIGRLRGELSDVLANPRPAPPAEEVPDPVNGAGPEPGEERTPPPWLARAQAAAAARESRRVGDDGQGVRSEPSPGLARILEERGEPKPLLEQGELSAQRSGLLRALLVVVALLLVALGVLAAVLASGGNDPAGRTAQDRAAADPSPRRPSASPRAARRGAPRRPRGARPRPIPARGALVPLRRPDGTATGGGPRGVARLVRPAGQTHLRLTLQGFPNPNGRYELWLYTSRRRARSVASFGSSPPAVDVPLTADPRRYRFVDLSVEPPNGNPAHSAQSVVRASISDLLRPAPESARAPGL